MQEAYKQIAYQIMIISTPYCMNVAFKIQREYSFNDMQITVQNKLDVVDLENKNMRKGGEQGALELENKKNRPPLKDVQCLKSAMK